MNEFDIKKLEADYMFQRDDQEYAYSDTLDVKTSVMLALLVFLAGETADFFHAGLHGCGRALGFLAAFAIAGGAILGIVELWPRMFQAEGSPREYEEWVDQLREFCSENESSENVPSCVLEQIAEGRGLRAMERCEVNIALNRTKSIYLFVTFIFSAVALSANLAILIMRLF